MDRTPWSDPLCKLLSSGTPTTCIPCADRGLLVSPPASQGSEGSDDESDQGLNTGYSHADSQVSATLLHSTRALMHVIHR